ncbi:protein S-acyltransferase 18 [Vigna unguiculata]|uniref:S-acyltransferase n=1 Tax=Vigna unguiculata TaxID=3917 RepID=A0A4D6N2S2_VIGUN|nr:protein S-acyltransferase 18 [Vigna unguiculata]QCE07174.1 slingshot [Vigna unguiculata]
MRRHGWQRPLHSLQFVGAAVYAFLVVCFYTFLGLFLGNRTAELTLTLAFSVVATSVMFLFVRCTAIDPTDRTSFRKKKKKKRETLNATPKLNYGFILGQIVIRFFRRVERKLLRTFIKRKYLDPLKTSPQMEPLLPFPLVMKDDDDAIAPDLKEDDISFCALCDFEVKKHSKHCRTCNRCVEGFDHHCRWLNNCVGKRNYTTFFLLMIFVLLMLLIEGGVAIAIFIRCFADKRGIEKELQSKLHIEFPRGVLATICVLLLLLTAYSSAALGQLFFFHVVLIRKGMRTYDYILAMREENEAMELESLDDSDFSSEESFDFDSPEKPTLMSKFLCKGNQGSPRLSIRIERETEPSPLIKTKKFHVSINPWKLVKLTREKALLAAEKARERLVKEKPTGEQNSLKPLPLETKSGPLMNSDKTVDTEDIFSTSFIAKGRVTGSPGRFTSPRRRFSAGSPTVFSSNLIASPHHKYRSSFDLKLTDVSRELETHISRQVLCSVIGKDDSEASPRSIVF